MTDKTAVEAIAEGLRESDPEGCDEEWSYEPQATRLIEWLKANGFAVVPVEPTSRMLWDGCESYGDKFYFNQDHAANCYRAMIAAAQGGE